MLDKTNPQGWLVAINIYIYIYRGLLTYLPSVDSAPQNGWLVGHAAAGPDLMALAAMKPDGGTGHESRSGGTKGPGRRGQRSQKE